MKTLWSLDSVHEKGNWPVASIVLRHLATLLKSVTVLEQQHYAP